MHVVHLIQSLEVGGAEKLLIEFARHTNPRRFVLTFVALGDDGPVGQELRAAGHSVTTLGCPAGLAPGLVRQLMPLLRRTGVDVLHTHDPRTHLYGTLAGRLAGVKRVIHTRHGQGGKLSRRQRWLVSIVARWNDRFVCVSHDAAQFARRQRIPASRIDVIWNGIDLDRFRYRPPEASGPVVTVARLSHEKDQPTLLKAVASAAKTDPGIRLEIAGDGPCRSELEQLSRSLAIEGRVRFLGTVQDVPQFLASSGIFVLASRSEGIPLTVLEALAAGTPVIATRVGGVPEIITDGESGILVPVNEPETLARAILAVRGDAELSRRLGWAGRQRVEESFNVRRMVGQYEELYTKLAG